MVVEEVDRGVGFMQGLPWCLIACASALESALACPNERQLPAGVSKSSEGVGKIKKSFGVR